jgi:manganese/zinc/iron transport system permease protein
MDQLLELITTYHSLTVILTTALLGAACGAVGSFTVLRERALIGDCVAHASLPGICAAFIFIEQRSFLPLFFGAIIAGLLSSWCVSAIRDHTRIKEDTAIAIVLSSFFGLGITLSRSIQNTPTGAKAGLDSFILGKAASITDSDLIFIACVAVITAITITAFFKELTMLCFDRVFTRAQGYPARILDLILMSLVCLCTAAGLPAVGAVLVVALLIIPAATARLWSDRIGVMVPLSAGFGALASILGTTLSATISLSGDEHGLATGPVIVIVLAAIFCLSLVVSPRHGLAQRRSHRLVSDRENKA